MFVQRAMQADDVALGKYRIERGIKRTHVSSALMCRELDRHAEGPAYLRDSLAQGARPNDAQC